MGEAVPMAAALPTATFALPVDSPPVVSVMSACTLTADDRPPDRIIDLALFAELADAARRPSANSLYPSVYKMYAAYT